MTEALLDDGWLPATPNNDTLTRAFVVGYATWNLALARAQDRPALHADAAVAVDSSSPSPFLNVSVVMHPLHRANDSLLDAIDEFYAARPGGPYLVVSSWPTPDLASRGYELMGHPPFMFRPAAPEVPPAPAGLEIVAVNDAGTLATWGETCAQAYPLPGVDGASAFTPAVLDVAGWHMWLAYVEGRPVGTAAAHVGDVVDVEMISTLPAFRGRGIGEALTWAATLADPNRPALLIASDAGRPVYERMGYLALARFTLWVGSRR